MGRMLNIAIVVLLIAWILGMVFSAVFGLLIHLLLLFAFIAIIIRIYLWLKPKRHTDRKAGDREGQPA